MSMSKKDFIALADAIRWHNGAMIEFAPFTKEQVETMANFCRSQNPRFMRDRWLSYIAGECGPNGGGVKKAVQS